MQINRTRGDTLSDYITVMSTTAKGVANITGFTFKLTVDRRPDPEDESTKVYQISGIIRDAVNGVVEFPLTALQADQVGYFYYDIQMTDAAGKVITPLSGSYVYKQDITK